MINLAGESVLRKQVTVGEQAARFMAAKRLTDKMSLLSRVTNDYMLVHACVVTKQAIARARPVTYRIHTRAVTYFS